MELAGWLVCLPWVLARPGFPNKREMTSGIQWDMGIESQLFVSGMTGWGDRMAVSLHCRKYGMSVPHTIDPSMLSHIVLAVLPAWNHRKHSGKIKIETFPGWIVSLAGRGWPDSCFFKKMFVPMLCIWIIYLGALCGWSSQPSRLALPIGSVDECVSPLSDEGRMEQLDWIATLIISASVLTESPCAYAHDNVIVRCTQLHQGNVGII